MLFLFFLNFPHVNQLDLFGNDEIQDFTDVEITYGLDSKTTTFEKENWLDFKFDSTRWTEKYMPGDKITQPQFFKDETISRGEAELTNFIEKVVKVTSNNSN